MMKKSADFLRRHLDETGRREFELNYRYEHSIRVSNIAIKIAKEENADVVVVALSSILHDIGKFDTTENLEHGRISAEIARPFLKNFDLTKSQIHKICYSIEAHVNDWKRETITEDLLEANILKDADRIDRFGFNKVFLRRFLDHQKSLNDAQNQIDLTERRIDILHGLINEDRMVTNLGKEIFNNRVDFQIKFYENYLNELRLSFLKNIDSL